MATNSVTRIFNLAGNFTWLFMQEYAFAIPYMNHALFITCNLGTDPIKDLICSKLTERILHEGHNHDGIKLLIYSGIKKHKKYIVMVANCKVKNMVACHCDLRVFDFQTQASLPYDPIVITCPSIMLNYMVNYMVVCTKHEWTY